MSPVYTSQTVGRMFLTLAGMIGDRIASGVCTSDSASLVAATAGSGLSAFRTDDDPAIIHKLVTIYEGAQIGDTVRNSAFTTATKTIVPLPAFAGNVDATSKWVIHNRDFDEYLEAMIQSSRMLTWDPLLQRGMMLPTESLRHIMIGNALQNATFHLFSSTNVPDNWSDGNSTLTEETTVTLDGAEKSLKVVTDGSNQAVVTQSLLRAGRWADKTLESYMWVHCLTADEVFLRWYDGVANHDSAKHGGTGWEKIPVEVSVDLGVTELTVEVRTTNTGAVTFRLQVVDFPLANPDDHEYPIDSDLGIVVMNGNLRISATGFSGDGRPGVNDFDIPVPAAVWDPVYTTTRAVRLKTGSKWNGRVLELTGFKAHTALASISTTWTGNIDGLLNLAAAIMLEGQRSPGRAPPVRRASGPSGHDRVEEVRRASLRTYGVQVLGGKVIEPVI